jgi:hypothetical protein
MLNLKDYIAIAFSAIALSLSLYNFYRSKKDARASNIRTIEQKRFEGVAILSEVRASQLRNQAAFEAVRFEALMAGNADIVRMADSEILGITESINSLSTMQEDDLLKGEVNGTHDELLKVLLNVETFIGIMKKRKAQTVEDEAQTARHIAGYRQNLLATSASRLKPTNLE